MTTAYSYIRMSRPEQLRGDSLRRQMEMSKLYADQQGLRLDSSLELTDIGISAHKGENRIKGKLALFLAQVDKGNVTPGSYLLIESMDRLSREEVHVALEQFLSLIRKGIVIVTLTDQQVFDKAALQDYTKLIMSIVVMARAHEESAQKSRRLAAAWSNKRERAKEGGNRLTAKAPAWLKIKSDRAQFELIPSRASVVERIFRETIEGLGALSITRRLNEDRTPPFGKATAWHISTVKKILGNESVFGRYQPHTLQTGKRMPIGDPIEDYYPAAISEATYWQARQSIDSRAKRGAGRKGATFTNVFSGLAYCIACGSRMAVLNKGKPPKGGLYLQCYSAMRHSGCKNRHLFRMDEVETGLLHLLAATPLPHPFNRIAQEQEAITARLAEIDGQISSINKRIERYAKAFGDDDGSFDDAISEKVWQMRSEKNELRHERRALRKKRSTVAAIGSGGDDVHERLNHYQAHIAALEDPDAIYRERARLAQQLRKLVRRIDFYGNAAVVEYFDTDETGTLLVNGNEPSRDVPWLALSKAG